MKSGKDVGTKRRRLRQPSALSSRTAIAAWWSRTGAGWVATRRCSSWRRVQAEQGWLWYCAQRARRGLQLAQREGPEEKRSAREEGGGLLHDFVGTCLLGAKIARPAVTYLAASSHLFHQITASRSVTLRLAWHLGLHGCDFYGTDTKPSKPRSHLLGLVGSVSIIRCVGLRLRVGFQRRECVRRCDATSYARSCHSTES